MSSVSVFERKKGRDMVVRCREISRRNLLSCVFFHNLQKLISTPTHPHTQHIRVSMQIYFQWFICCIHCYTHITSLWETAALLLKLIVPTCHLICSKLDTDIWLLVSSAPQQIYEHVTYVTQLICVDCGLSAIMIDMAPYFQIQILQLIPLLKYLFNKNWL